MSDAVIRLSALVVARDEAGQLADCLGRLGFADEIVVVLDRCTDDSRRIAERFTDRILEGAWEREGARRNAGIDACRGAWLLEVDADERVTPELAAEVRRIVVRDGPGHYLVPYHNFVGDRLVRYGWGASWGVAATVRLFARGCKRWGDARVHPAVELLGPCGRLASPMIHLIGHDVAHLMRRLDRYTTARAADLRESGDIGTLPGNVRRCVARFVKLYVVRRGYREGALGFLNALFAGLYPLLAHLKARLDRPD
ncbi:MAG: glycosyltransferase family 2 protein [Alphaproteobacteria bacterium]